MPSRLRAAALVALGLDLVACASAPPPVPPMPPPMPPLGDLREPVPRDTQSRGLGESPSPRATSSGESAAVRDVEQAKDRVMAAVSANDGGALWRLYDAKMQADFPLEATTTLVQGVFAAKGVWHKATREPGARSSTHGAWLVLADRGTWRLEIELDGDGRVGGLLVTPAGASPPPVARSDVPLGLPFRGEWFVTWGGDSVQVNHHVPVSDQRRAADLMILGPAHRTFRTDGRANEDYLVFGQEVLAVADGVVETVVDGVPENVPHEENHYEIYGNYVLVRHGPALYSGYMHLQPGAMRVRPGQRVKRGAVLGLVGNTGHSTEPHLHFQLQDGPDGNKAWGVEPVFERVVVTRAGRAETVEGYELLRGDLIRAP